MVKLILIKELHYYILNRKLLFSWMIIILLMIVNVFVSSYNYSKSLEKYNNLTINNENNLRSFNSSDLMAKIFDPKIGKTNKLSDLVFVKQLIPKKPSKLSFISSTSSISHIFPDGVELDYFKFEFPKFLIKLNEYLPAIVSIDWKNVILYFISFLCLAFSFNSFSDEKQNGTLKLIMTNSISRSKILSGKFFGLLITISTPLIIGIIISLILFIVLFNFQFSNGEFLNILVFTFLSIIFVAFNILVGFLISILSSSSNTSLNICLMFWILMLLVIPNLSWMIIKSSSKIATINNIRTQAEDIKNQTFKKYNVNWDDRWIGENPPPKGVYNIAKAMNEIDNLQNKIWDEYRNKLFRQANNSIMLSKISPYYIFDYCSDVISDNNIPGIENFYRQALNYSNIYCDYIKNKDLSDKESHHLIWNHYGKIQTFMTNYDINVKDMPLFKYRNLNLTEIFNKIKFDILILIFYCMLLYAGVFISFLKYNVK